MPTPLLAVVIGIILLVLAYYLTMLPPPARQVLTALGVILLCVGGLFLVLELVGYPRTGRASLLYAFQTAVDRPGAVPANPMDANAIALIGVPVVALTQIVKWSGLPDQFGPLVVLVLAAVGVGVWVASYGGFHQADLFNYFVATITTAVAAAGTFGFTRAAAAAVTRVSPPSSAAAGGSPTSP